MHLNQLYWLSTVAQANNPSTEDMETGGSWVWGQPGLWGETVSKRPKICIYINVGILISYFADEVSETNEQIWGTAEDRRHTPFWNNPAISARLDQGTWTPVQANDAGPCGLQWSGEKPGFTTNQAKTLREFQHPQACGSFPVQRNDKEDVTKMNPLHIKLEILWFWFCGVGHGTRALPRPGKHSSTELCC
jgi:hypothetical protein